jgi:hypothetical protein
MKTPFYEPASPLPFWAKGIGVSCSKCLLKEICGMVCVLARFDSWGKELFPYCSHTMSTNLKRRIKCGMSC